MVEAYENDVTRQMDEYNKKTTRQKYASVDKYAEFRQGIFVCQSFPFTPPTNIRRPGGATSRRADSSHQRSRPKRFVSIV